MIEQQELVSWLAFPDVAQWSAFEPVLEHEVHETERRIGPKEADAIDTESLADAVAVLGGHRFPPVTYRACAQQPELDSPRQAGVRYELDWSISDPSGERPREIRRRSRSRLWSRSNRCLAYFALSYSMRDRSIHLTVGGANPEECGEIWSKVSRWVRKLYQLQFRNHWMPSDVRISERPRAEVRRDARELRDRIREAVVEAARIEKGPFHLTGRGHEARVALTVKLAAILRGLDLPSAHISGYGPNNFYPYRVFDRAARMLRKKLRRAVLKCDGYHFYLPDPEVGRERPVQ